jgi:D-aminoacyl-tRNA deacylase
MRALIQRVKNGSVTIDGIVHASIGRGFVVLIGVKVGDTPEEAEFLADKCASLRPGSVKLRGLKRLSLCTRFL